MTATNDTASAWPRLRIAQWVVIVALLATSEAAAFLGYSITSWDIDGLALVALVGFTYVRRRVTVP